jgi:hypothetical protein
MVAEMRQDAGGRPTPGSGSSGFRQPFVRFTVFPVRAIED